MNKNRGTGAGGANTNKSGLALEAACNHTIEAIFDTKSKYGDIKNVYQVMKDDMSFLYVKKRSFPKLMEHLGACVSNGPKAYHGAKEPDSCLVDTKTKKIVIIEMKNQNVSGSVCEKLQTVPMKLMNFERRLRGWTVVYVYILAPLLIEKCEQEIHDLCTYANMLHRKSNPTKQLYICSAQSNWNNEILQILKT